MSIHDRRNPDPTIIPFNAQDIYLVASGGTKEFQLY